MAPRRGKLLTAPCSVYFFLPRVLLQVVDVIDEHGAKVASGEELPDTGMLHCSAMERGYTRIALIQVLDANALLMRPTEEAKTLGEAAGSVIQWPKELLREEVSFRDACVILRVEHAVCV